MSEQKPSHEVERIVHRVPRQDCVKTQVWGRVSNNSVALKVLKNTVASIIFKWKKWNNQNLPRAGLQAKLSNWSRALVREVTKNPMVTLIEFLCGDGRTFQKDNHLCSTPPIRLYW